MKTVAGSAPAARPPAAAPARGIL